MRTLSHSSRPLYRVRVWLLGYQTASRWLIGVSTVVVMMSMTNARGFGPARRGGRWGLRHHTEPAARYRSRPASAAAGWVRWSLEHVGCAQAHAAAGGSLLPLEGSHLPLTVRIIPVSYPVPGMLGSAMDALALRADQGRKQRAGYSLGRGCRMASPCQPS